MLLETSLFDTIAGLPVHPLAVHFAVVLAPLAALLLAALVVVRRWRAALATPALIALAGGTVATFVAKESGEALGHRLGGYPETHGLLGSTLPWVVLGLLVVGAAWWFLQRRDRRAAGPDAPLTRVAGAVVVVAALAVTVLATLVGHSGATSVWSGRMEPTSGVTPLPATPSAAAPSASTPAPAATSASGITMAQVKQHATAASCWTAMDGSVYDLTSWITRHPGGPERIVSMCGTDASAAFRAQHGTQREPNADLAKFRIGALSH